MPYLRLYSRDIPIVLKRRIAQNLIDIIQRTFQPHLEQAARTTIQFVTVPQGRGVVLESPIPREAPCMLEVIAHDLSRDCEQAFAAKAAPMLADLMPVNWRGQIARRLGLQPIKPEHIAFQFNQLSPAVSDPLETDRQRVAA